MPAVHPKTTEIISMARAGWTDATISGQLEIPSYTVANVLRTARSKGKVIARRSNAGRPRQSFLVTLPEGVREVLREHALQRSMTDVDLAHMLLVTALRHNLVDAIIDDGETDE